MRRQPTAGRERSSVHEQRTLASLDEGAVTRERRLARVSWHPDGRVKEQLLIHERDVREAPPTLVPSDFPAPPTDGLSAGDALALVLAVGTASAGGWLGWQIDGPWAAAYGSAAGLLVSTTITAGAGSIADRARSLLHLVLAIVAIAGAMALGNLIGGPEWELAAFFAALAAAVLLMPQS